MKSKFIFIVLLFSLFLNISHDILIAQDTATCQTTLSVSETMDSNDLECCNGLSELHEIFHFSAILSSFFKINISDFTSVKLLFISSVAPTPIQQTTFKPPIV